MKTQENMIPIKELFDAKLAALEKSIAVAANLMDTRLHAMNEFRLQLRDQTLTFLTKNEHQIMVDSLHKDIKFITDDIRVLRDLKSLLEGKASQKSVNLALLFSILGTVLGILAIVAVLVKV